MLIPRYWARLQRRDLCALGWSDTSQADAERHARERLERLATQHQKGRRTTDWEYYPNHPIKEEIVEDPKIPGIRAVVTRNRAGALVLNVDRVAFVDIDLHKDPDEPARRSGGCLFGGAVRSRSPSDRVHAAIQGCREWALAHGARFRVHRTAGGLRLIRLDRQLDPTSEQTLEMLAGLGSDPLFARLCTAQKCFRARLTPKPRRIDLPDAPGTYPRTEETAQRAFRQWLESYERKISNWSVCQPIEEIGSGPTDEACRRLAEFHDQRTVRPGLALA